MEENRFDLRAAVELNRARLEQRFEQARLDGDEWLVECRDLWDALDRDAGVYFVPCPNAAAVHEVLRQCADDSPDNRVLGIFRTRTPLDAQGPGLTRTQWLSRTERDP